MGGTTDGVPPRARALGIELRRHREATGLGLRQLANQLAMPHATLSRYETGSRHPRPEDVARICTAIGVNGSEVEELIALAKDTDRSRWLSEGMTEQQRQLATVITYEQTAARVISVSSLIIPGLLQTADYARAIMHGNGVDAHEIELRVTVRMGRRDILARPTSPLLVAVIGEAALRQHIGDRDVMHGQLTKLLEFSEWPNIDLRVVPFTSGWHDGLMGPFVLVEFVDADPIVHLEALGSGLFLHESKDTDRYVDACANVRRVAMSPEDSSELIANVRNHLG